MVGFVVVNFSHDKVKLFPEREAHMGNKLFIAAIGSGFRKGTSGTVFAPLLIAADSKEEAEKLARKEGERRYPSSDGYGPVALGVEPVDAEFVKHHLGLIQKPRQVILFDMGGDTRHVAGMDGLEIVQVRLDMDEVYDIELSSGERKRVCAECIEQDDALMRSIVEVLGFDYGECPLCC